MNINKELNDFENNLSLNKLPSGFTFLIYDIHLGKDKHDENYQNLLDVIKNIIVNSQEDWPSDNEWRTSFSKKFNAHFPDLTREQCDEMLKNKPQESWSDLPWDFGSWLDILKRRTWRWVAHQKNGKFLQVALRVYDPDAGDLEAFDEIFNACSAKVIRREVVSV